MKHFTDADSERYAYAVKTADTVADALQQLTGAKPTGKAYRMACCEFRRDVVRLSKTEKYSWMLNAYKAKFKAGRRKA